MATLKHSKTTPLSITVSINLESSDKMSLHPFTPEASQIIEVLPKVSTGDGYLFTGCMAKYSTDSSLAAEECSLLTSFSLFCIRP